MSIWEDAQKLESAEGSVWDKAIALKENPIPDQDPDTAYKESKDTLNLSVDYKIPIETVEANYDEIANWSPEQEEPVEEQPEVQGLQFEAAPEPSFWKKFFTAGYEGAPKPEHYWDMNPAKRYAFDAYMAGRHFMTRVGGAAAVQLGLVKKNEILDLYEDELVNNPEWYTKAPEATGIVIEKVAEYYALKGIFKATGLSKLLSAGGKKLAAPFIGKEIVSRGGIQAVNTLSREGLKRVTNDGIAAFLRFAPENTAFLATWSAGSAALQGEDKSEAAIAGALWGLGFSALTPVVGGLGKIAIATKAGQKLQFAASQAYTALWRNYPRLMNAGRKPFSDEFLAEAERQYKARFGIEPTAADVAKLKKMTRMVGDEITKNAQKEAAMNAYWNSGKKAAEETAKAAPVKPAELAKVEPQKPVKPITKAPAVDKILARPAEAVVINEDAVGSIPGKLPKAKEGTIRVYHSTNISPDIIQKTGLEARTVGKADIPLIFAFEKPSFTHGKNIVAFDIPAGEIAEGEFREGKKEMWIGRNINPVEIVGIFTRGKPTYPSKAAETKQLWEMTKAEFQEATKKGVKTSLFIGEIDKYTPFDKGREELIRNAWLKGKSIPLEILKEFKGQKWADNAIARAAPPKVEAPPKQVAEVAEKIPEAQIAPPITAREPVTVKGQKFHPVTLPTEKIGVDPKKFQFKLGAKLAGGVTSALKDVEAFDPVKGGQILVWQDKAGKYFVVDGHHRVALAKKTGAENLETWVIREADGWTAADARATGALRNLADGKGTAVDAAKLFRDSNVSLADLRKAGVPTNNAIVQQGMEMKNLSDYVFRLVVDEKLPTSYAAVVGKHVKGDAQQKQVADLILEGEVDTVRQAELLAATIDTAPVLTESEQTLFGLETTEKSLYAERAKILANVERKLKTDKKVFGVLAKQTGIIEAKGNVLAKIENLQAKEHAEEILFMLEKLANSKGPVAEALNDATKGYAKNPTKANLSEVTKTLLEKWTEGPARLRFPGGEGVSKLPLERAGQEAVLEPRPGELKDEFRARVRAATKPEPLKETPETIEAIRVQKIKNSIVEGELILRTGEFRGEKVSDEQLEVIRKSVEKEKAKLPPPTEFFSAGQGGFIDVTPLAKLHETFMSIIEPSKAVEIAQGKDVYAEVIKAIHRPDVAMIEFNEKQLEAMDRTLGEWGKTFAKYSDSILELLMLSRGKPATPDAIRIHDQALQKLAFDAPELVGTRKMITRVSDFNYDYLKEVVGDEVGYVDDYFYGVYKDPRLVERFLTHWKTTKRFIKEKKLPTVADAKSFGLDLRHLNPVDNLRAEYMAIARLEGMIDLKESLMKSGEGKYIDQSIIAPLEWVKIHDPVFADVRVEPELGRMINNLISTNKITRIPILNTVRQINNFLRTLKFVGSAFHLAVEAKQSMADSGYLGFLHKPTTARGLTLGFKQSDPIFQTPEYKDYLTHGGGHRFSIDSEAQRAFTNMLAKMGKAGAIAKGVALPFQVPERFVRWMFENYIPKLKYSKYLDSVRETEVKLGRSLKSAEKIDIVKEAQNFYGMMNERLFGRSGTVTTILRLKFMAPGFAEGNFRSILKAVLQWGGNEGFKASRSRANIINSFIISAIAATVGTIFLTGRPPEKPEKLADIRDLFKIDTGKVDQRGRKIMIDMLTYDKDYWDVFGNLATGQPAKAASSTIRRLGGMTATTWEVISDLNQMSMGRAVYDWKGDRVTEITDSFIEKTLKLSIHELKKAEPIATNVFQQARQKGVGLALSAAMTLAGVRLTKSEQDKREIQVLSKIFSLRDQQERLFWYLGTIDNPREKIKKYNQTVMRILDNPITPVSIKDEYEPKLIIDVKRLTSNKVYNFIGDKARLAEYSQTPEKYQKEIKDLRDDVQRGGKWLKNFEITESQYRSHLIAYEENHRKIIKEIQPEDNLDDLKKELAQFYADQTIVKRRIQSGNGTRKDRRSAKKFSVIGDNISMIARRIYDTENENVRESLFGRIQSVVKRAK